MITYYLCVKTHQKTGLKYLCQTKSADPYNYKGSGTNWQKHLKEYGNVHTTEILRECYTKEELKKYGLYYSSLWNVVESDDWANLKPEDGGGGWYLTGDKNPQKRKDIREKTSLGMKKYLLENPRSEERKKQHSEWNKSYWTAERKIQHINCLKNRKNTNGTVAVTDLDGIGKRIPKIEYDTMTKNSNIMLQEYVSAVSNEANRRRILKTSP